MCVQQSKKNLIGYDSQWVFWSNQKLNTFQKQIYGDTQKSHEGHIYIKHKSYSKDNLNKSFDNLNRECIDSWLIQ